MDDSQFDKLAVMDLDNPVTIYGESGDEHITSDVLVGVGSLEKMDTPTGVGEPGDSSWRK